MKPTRFLTFASCLLRFLLVTSSSTEDSGQKSVSNGDIKPPVIVTGARGLKEVSEILKSLPTDTFTSLSSTSNSSPILSFLSSRNAALKFWAIFDPLRCIDPLRCNPTPTIPVLTWLAGTVRGKQSSVARSGTLLFDPTEAGRALSMALVAMLEIP